MFKASSAYAGGTESYTVIETTERFSTLIMTIKNIIIYSEKLPPKHIGGIETNAFYLICNLSRENQYNIHVVSIGKPKFGFLRAEKNRYNDIEVTINYLKKPESRSAKKVLKSFKTKKYVPSETLIYHNTLDLYHHYPVLKKMGYIQIARSGGNDIFYEDRDKEPSLVSNMRFLDKLIVNSEYSRGRSANQGIPEKLMEVIKGGCEAAKINAMFNAPFPLSDKIPLLLFCGRLVDFKGIDDALHALAIVKEHGFRFHFAIVGDGEDRHQLELLKERLNLSDDVKFYGKITPSEVLTVYCRASIYISSSKDVIRKTKQRQYIHTETMGRSICEAQVNGVPVVCTNTGGSVEMLIDGKTGIVVPQGSAKDLADAIMFFLSHEDLQQSYARAAKRFAGRAFSWNTVISKTKDIIDMVSQDTKRRKIPPIDSHRKPPIFIVGGSRSGTRLSVHRINEHSNMACGPETEILKKIEPTH